MTELKEQAMEIIRRMPEENMTYVMGILQNLEAMTAPPAGAERKLDRFFSAAGRVRVDAEAVDRLRRESMI